MERALIKSLAAWKENPEKKPLIVKSVQKKYHPRVSVKTSIRFETNGKEVLNIPLYLISSLKKVCQMEDSI